MNTNTTSLSAASSEAGNSQALAQAWVDYCKQPDNKNTRERLGSELDPALRTGLPNGRLPGILKGKEEDLRQEAGLMLLKKYLAGNKKLVEATLSGDMPEIVRQIERSVCASINISIWQLKKSLLKDGMVLEFSEAIDAHPRAVSAHPAWRNTLWELPLALQRELVFSCLRSAVREKHLLETNANIALTMMDKGLTQSEMAGSLGISRQAIHQRLAPVRKYLRKHIKDVEFPMS